MYRAIKCPNKLLEKRWQSSDYSKHRQRLGKIRASIDNACPKSQISSSYLTRQAKKQVQQEIQYIEIERENRVLLQKMTQIMVKNPQKSQIPKRKVKSLNIEKRKQEIVKIALENQAMLNRIITKKASYNKNTWQSQRQREEHMLQNICEFPYNLKSQKQLKQHNSKSIFNRPRSKSIETIQDNRIVLYKKTHQINQGHYLIEISKAKHSLYFSAHDILDSGQALALEVPAGQGKRIIQECNGNYQQLANKIKIVNSHLILKEPVKSNNSSRQETYQSQKQKQKSNMQMSLTNMQVIEEKEDLKQIEEKQNKKEQQSMEIIQRDYD